MKIIVVKDNVCVDFADRLVEWQILPGEPEIVVTPVPNLMADITICFVSTKV